MSSRTALWTEFKVQPGLCSETLSQDAKSTLSILKFKFKTKSQMHLDNATVVCLT